MPHSRSLFLAGLAALWMGGLAAHTDGASDAEKTALGEEPTPLLALPLGDAPGATFVITQEEIERSGAANLFELLRRVPGVDIRYTPMGGHIGIRSNGASPFSEQVLLLIDGSPYNSPDKGGFPGHPNYAGFFPLDRIARIEIVRGPISVLYGANALGGVINIVSKRAGDALAGRVEGYAAGATVRAGTRGLFDRSIRTAMIRGAFEATLEAGAQDGETPIELNGDADHSRSHVYLALRKGNLWGSVLHQESRHGSFDFESQRTRTAHNNVDIVDAHYDRKFGSLVVRASATLNRYRGTTCAVCHNAATRAPDDLLTEDVADERETDQRVRLALRAEHTLTDAQDLSFGFDAARDSVDRNIVRLDVVDEKIDSGGVYLQHQLHLGRGAFHVLTGVRLDFMESLGDVLSPRIALVSEPRANLVLRGSWSRAYRAPTWNERFRRQRFLPDDLAPGLILVLQGNPELERERVDATEAGVSWQPWEDLVLRADLYEHEVDRFIELGPTTFVPGAPSELRAVYQNREESFKVRGGEITAIARPMKDFSLTGGYAYRDLTLETSDAAASYAPRSRVTLAAAWTPGRWSFDVAGGYSSRYTVSLPSVFGVRPQPGYTIVDSALRRSFEVSSVRFNVGVIGKNLTDSQPAETLVGPDIDTRLRGRAFAVEIRADF